MGNAKKNEKRVETERRSLRSHPVEKSFGRSYEPVAKTDYEMMNV